MSSDDEGYLGFQAPTVSIRLCLKLGDSPAVEIMYDQHLPPKTRMQYMHLPDDAAIKSQQSNIFR